MDVQLRTKSEFREFGRRCRKELPELDNQKFSSIICSRISNWLQNKNFKTLALYSAIDGEVDLWPLFNFVQGKYCIVFPRVVRNNDGHEKTEPKSQLDFFVVKTKNQLESGYKNILEPSLLLSQAVSIENLDLILVPGTIFSPDGYRIGFGKGFFDNTLARLKESTVKVGVSFFCQIVSQIPHDEKDQKVDALVTERGFIWISKNKD